MAAGHLGRGTFLGAGCVGRLQTKSKIQKHFCKIVLPLCARRSDFAASLAVKVQDSSGIHSGSRGRGSPPHSGTPCPGLEVTP